MKDPEESVSIGALLRPDTVRLELSGRTKIEIIDELVDVLDRAGLVTDRVQVREAVVEREKKLSTAMEHGVAVPHGKTSGVDRLVAAFGIKPQGVYFDARDGEPSRLFFLVVSPESISGPHVKALASIARCMNSAAHRGRILKAKSAEEVLRILRAVK
jgi:PTS system nitrogen regulatory IIA component